MDLFDYMREQNKEKESPLASRMRPTSLEEVVGQQHIIGKDRLLYCAIQADKLQLVIFTDLWVHRKTTLVQVIAHTTSARFHQDHRDVQVRRRWREAISRRKTPRECMKDDSVY